MKEREQVEERNRLYREHSRLVGWFFDRRVPDWVKRRMDHGDIYALLRMELLCAIDYWLKDSKGCSLATFASKCFQRVLRYALEDGLVKVPIDSGREKEKTLRLRTERRDLRYVQVNNLDEEEMPREESIADVAQGGALFEIEEYRHLVTPREMIALRMRFGFDGEPATLQEIADRLRFSKERARQVINNGLRRIRDSPHFKEWLEGNSR